MKFGFRGETKFQLLPAVAMGDISGADLAKRSAPFSFFKREQLATSDGCHRILR